MNMQFLMVLLTTTFSITKGQGIVNQLHAHIKIAIPNRVHKTCNSFQDGCQGNWQCGNMLNN